MDILVMNGSEIFPYLEERKFHGKVIAKTLGYILYETENSLIKKTFEVNKNSINEYGDYAFRSSILLEAFCINVLSKNNQNNYPKLIDVFTNDGFLCLEIEKINGVYLNKVSELDDTKKDAIFFQIVYALYLASVYEFSYGYFANNDSIIIEFVKPEIIKYVIEGKEFMISNGGVNVKFCEFGLSRMTAYSTYIFNEDIRANLYVDEYDCPFHPAKDLYDLLTNSSILPARYSEIFKDIEFKINSYGLLIKPYPNITSLMILQMLFGFKVDKPFEQTKNINEVKSLSIPKNSSGGEKDCYHLINDPTKIRNKMDSLKYLSDNKYNRLMYKLFTVFPDIKLDVNKIHVGGNSYSNSRKIINKILSLSNTLTYTTPSVNFTSYRLDQCALDDNTLNGNVYDPIMLEYVNEDEWLNDDNNIIIELNSVLYATKKFYFNEIPNNNILLPVVFNGHNVSFKNTINGVKYLNLNKYGIPIVVSLDRFLSLLDHNRIVLNSNERDSMCLISYNYVVNNPKSYFSKAETSFYGYDIKHYQSLKNYTHHWDRAINSYLRKNISDNEYLKDSEFLKYYKEYGNFPLEALENIKDVIKNIDNAFLNSSKTEYEIIVYRGIRENTIYDGLSPGYTSTTTSYSTANRFSENDGVIYEIKIPKGIPFISLENISTYKGENEYLFPRNIILKHLGDYKFILELQDENQFNVKEEYKYYNVSLVDVSSKNHGKCSKNNFEDGNLIDEITGDVIDPDNSINDDGMCFNRSTLLKLLDKTVEKHENGTDSVEFVNPFTRIKFSKDILIEILNNVDYLETYFMFFIDKHNLEIVTYLAEKYNYLLDKKDDLLLHAIMIGNLDILKFFIEKGANVNYRDNEPLIRAINCGNIKIVKFLIEKGADVSCRDNKPLRIATNRGDLDTMKLLLENGADIHARNDEFLLVAITKRNLDILNFLITNGININKQDDKVFMYAIRSNSLKILKFLVENGLKVVVREYKYIREILTICNIDTLKFLVEIGVDFHLRSDEELTREFIGDSSTDKLEILIARNYMNRRTYEEVLLRSISHGDLETVKFLLDNGTDIHVKNDEPLLKSIFHDNLEIIEILLDNGADIHARNDEALFMSIERNSLHLLSLLIKNGADIHARNDEALFMSIFHGNLEIIKFLLDNGADIHGRNDEALLRVIKNSKSIIIKSLLDNGADQHDEENILSKLVHLVSRVQT